MKGKLADFFSGIKTNVEEHDTQIMTTSGVIIMIAGAAISAIAGVRIYKKLNDIQEAEQNEPIPLDEEHPKLKKAIKIGKKIWPEVLIPMAVETTGAFLVFKSESKNIMRIAELSEGLKLTGIALADAQKYSEKVAEKIGDKADSDIRANIAKDRAEASRKPDSSLDIQETGNGGTLCYDKWSGRFFRCDIDRIRRAINDINHDMISERESQWEACRTLNDFYYEISLEPTRAGEILGWVLDAVNTRLLELRPSSILIDDMPCFAVDFSNPPMYLEPQR